MKNEIYDYVRGICESAKEASPFLTQQQTGVFDRVLLTAADMLISAKDDILAANASDIASAAENGVPDTMLDRLLLTEERIRGIADAMKKLAALENPVGSGTVTKRPNGLVIEHIRVPLGVVAAIYESRPNVTADISALCLKTGNAVVLRGGREALASNKAIVSVMRRALCACGLPENAVCLIERTEHESADALMDMRGLVDLLIPRGGKKLIAAVAEKSRVPVIETGAGNCHIYVDESADLSMACDIVANAKLSRPSVCNAAESLLVHAAVAGQFLPMLRKRLEEEHSVELRCDPAAMTILPGSTPASEEDFFTEYNDYIMSIKVVRSLDEAIKHINAHSTGHSEAIVTSDLESSRRFCAETDSAAVYVNASTRFTDGGEFGLGAEIGISTQKLHARGPMGLYALTTEKFLITGNGQVR